VPELIVALMRQADDHDDLPPEDDDLEEEEELQPYEDQEEPVEHVEVAELALPPILDTWVASDLLAFLAKMDELHMIFEEQEPYVVGYLNQYFYAIQGKTLQVAGGA
jgi:hypothetical protein